MTEPKLCPFRKINYQGDGRFIELLPTGFAPCLQDKCQMWRDEVLPEKKERKYPGGDITGVLASHVGDPAYQQPYMVVVEKEKTIGYCGLAGKV